MVEKIHYYNDHKIYYKISGKGETVLLIHGFGETGDIWKDIAFKLSVCFKVIIPDLPGSGQSELYLPEQKRNDEENFVSMEDYARVMKSILDAENNADSKTENTNRKISIIGHSMGGYIALSFSEFFPDLLNKLGLFHSSAFKDDENKIIVRKKSIEFIKKNGNYAFLRKSIPDLFSLASRTSYMKSINDLIEKGTNFSELALIQYQYAMMKRKDHSDHIKQMKIPVLFIIGEDDNAIPLGISLQQCHFPLISQIRVLKNAGHMGMIEDQDKCSGALMEFLTHL